MCASGEAIPLRSASFDVVMSDHGAVSFCDPDRSIPEVARVLRPGGRLVFCAPTWLLYVTWDPTRRRQTRRLVRPYFDVDVFATSEGTVDFVVRTGEWIRRMRTHGLVLDDLVDLRPPEGATTTYTDFVPYRWARRWPAEQLWIAHRQA